ncbi:MAG TPA: DUF488 domain-containing protein [Thermoanaerobaculia bacterium]
MRVYTIGHSTRSLDELIGLLREYKIGRLADIRRYPGSRRYPHFSREALAVSLPQRGIEYVHIPELGGRRKPATDSPNTAWRNEQFRGYADYMATPEFARALDGLLMSAVPTAIMCAEAVPWRCHRNLVADELTRRGHEVMHIIGPGPPQKHVMNPRARVENDHLTYPSS